MKANLKRLLALIMVLTLIFALVPAAFADEDDGFFGFGEDEEEHGKGLIIPEVEVEFNVFEVPLEVGQTAMVTAIVRNADASATYDWSCDDPGVASISGRGDTVSVTGRSGGSAVISLTVTRGDGASSSTDFFYANVEAASTPVVVNGGGSYNLEAGETQNLSASVSGGSGSYTYEWDTYGDGGLSFDDTMRNNATVRAGRAGSGGVMLTVYDAEDLSNNDTVMWSITVTEAIATAPEIELSRGAVDLGAGGSGSLQVAVSGGSGNFEYIWQSDNPRVVSVTGRDASAEINAASTLLPGANSAQISVHVRDRDTGLTSNTEVCVVNVSGGSASYNVEGSASVGQAFALDNMARRISDYYAGSFGQQIGYSASVRFQSTGSSLGRIYMQDGTAVKADTSYTFASFQDMYYEAATTGTFTTYYQIIDGGNTISGTISILATGGTGVTDVTISQTSMQLSTSSSQYLSISVSPARASYTVEWSVSDSRIASVYGSGNMVTISTGSRTGTTTVTATVTDVNGKQIQRSCNVSVYDSGARYDPSITIMMGSDYYGTSLSDSLSNRFRSVFGIYPTDSASIYFPSLGNSRYGTMYLRNGAAAVSRRNYNFRDFVDMYFVPAAEGTYNLDYQLSYQGYTLEGTMSVYIQAASLNVTLSPTALQMSTYSSQSIRLSVSPASAYYRVNWYSSDSRVASVNGSNTSATVTTSGTAGTATVYAVVTDRNGIEIRRNCTVVVSNSGSTFNPSVSTTLGVPYTGTGTSSAMRSQFQSVFGTVLGDNAIIRFSSTGNNNVAVMRLADGSNIRANTDYTLAQYVAMYTQPIAAGTFSVPYTLTYAGKSLSGTISVVVNSSNISTNITLSERAPYYFSDPLPSGTTGGTIFTDSIRNAVGSGWSYLRFGKTSDSTGTLYLNRNYSTLNTNSSVTPAALSQLFFVPGSTNGVFSAPYTVYTAAGGVLSTGTLSINAQGTVFVDVPAGIYYEQAVKWAVLRGVTSGTSATTFSPDLPVTRGQAVTFLWRAAGQPSHSISANPFTDVQPGAYYYDAVLWAVQQGITNGISDSAFGPELTLHRDQILTFLCRANGGYAGGSNWSELAVSWANARGLMTGIPGTFGATRDCPRCDVVYYLWKNYNG